MTDLRGVDLNLLGVFDALMCERSVTKAGDRLGLAQPSMSNALARLRDMFDDELFVRTPNGMMPTPTATKAAEHVTAAIFAAQEALNVTAPFAPESAEGTVTLLTNDFIEFTIVPAIVRALAQQAPGLRLQTRPLVDEAFERTLDAGIADLAIAAPLNVPKRFRFADLFVEPFKGIARKGHPVLSEPISLEAFFACKHVAVSHRFGGTGVIDAALHNVKGSLDVAVSVSNLASVPPLVSSTDFVAVVPRRLAEIANRELPITSFDLPFPAPSVVAKLIWGRGVNRSEMFTWFRGLVVETLREAAR